jgi:hypothetical protein
MDPWPSSIGVRCATSSRAAMPGSCEVRSDHVRGASCAHSGVADAGLTGVNPNWAPVDVLARMYTEEGARRIIEARNTEFWRTEDDFVTWAAGAEVPRRRSEDAKSSMLEVP